MTFIFGAVHDYWLVDHAGGIPGNVDMWAYTDWFHKLVDDFNHHFKAHATRNEVMHRYIALEKTRYRRVNGEIKLTKFARSNLGPLPKVSGIERLKLYKAYREEGVPLDRAMYTSAFARVCSVVPRLTEREVWRWMQAMRRKGRARGGPPCLFKGRTQEEDNVNVGDISELGSAGTRCIIKGCMRSRARDGLCLVCYSRAKKLVEAGKTTWEKLAEMGLAQPAVEPFDAAYDRERRKRAKIRETDTFATEEGD